jgi:hypothetical protein
VAWEAKFCILVHLLIQNLREFTLVCIFLARSPQAREAVKFMDGAQIDGAVVTVRLFDPSQSAQPPQQQQHRGVGSSGYGQQNRRGGAQSSSSSSSFGNSQRRHSRSPARRRGACFFVEILRQFRILNLSLSSFLSVHMCIHLPTGSFLFSTWHSLMCAIRMKAGDSPPRSGGGGGYRLYGDSSMRGGGGGGGRDSRPFGRGGRGGGGGGGGGGGRPGYGGGYGGGGGGARRQSPPRRSRSRDRRYRWRLNCLPCLFFVMRSCQFTVRNTPLFDLRVEYRAYIPLLTR